MSATVNKIIDSAEKWIRKGGFRGYSFADVSKDVGVKTSSIHHHFKTKEILTAEVVRRYTIETSEYFDNELAKGKDPIEVWVNGFRGTITSDKHTCPCTVLGANTLDLPGEVATEVQNFFQMNIDKMKTAGFSENGAKEFLSTITGAQLLANIFNDVSIFDAATNALLRASKIRNA